MQILLYHANNTLRLPTTEWLRLKGPTMSNADEDLEQLELPTPPGVEQVKCSDHCEVPLGKFYYNTAYTHNL